MEQDFPVIIGIASIPERQEMLRDTIDSLIRQSDFIHVFLNNYQSMPEEFLANPKIKCYQSQREKTDKGDAGKFFRVADFKNCYYCSADDDIIYPSGYVEKLKQKINEYNKKCIITFHGSVINRGEVQDYYHSRYIYHYLQQVHQDKAVHIGGTGVMGFFLPSLKIRYEDFEHANMADIFIFRLCQQQKIRIICAEHQADWIRINPKADPEKTIYSNHHDKDTIQTQIVNSFPEKFI